MAVRSTQFAARFITGASGDELLYEVPAGSRALVKWFALEHDGSDPTLVELYASGTPDGYCDIFYDDHSVGKPAITRNNQYAVLDEGQQLRLYWTSPDANYISAFVGGVLFGL